MIERTLCRYTPPTKGRLPTALAAFCLAVGFAAWVALPAVGWWTLGRIGAALLIAAGCGLAMRWLARCYTYTLEQHENGAVDFVVTVEQGRRRATACRISCEQITAVAPTPEKRRQRLRARTYVYCNAPFPRQSVTLVVRDGDGVQAVRITPSEEMARLLRLLCGGAGDASFV